MIDNGFMATLMLATGLILGLGQLALAAEPELEKTAAAIREEAVRPNGDPEGHQLPLFGVWCPGTLPVNAHRSPDRQMEWIAQGHYVLPTFDFPVIRGGGDRPPLPENITEPDTQRFDSYYTESFRKAAALRLPFVLVGTQWECLLSRSPYLDLPEKDNPNVIMPDGKVEKIEKKTFPGKVCPFGSIAPWVEVGRLWTDNPWMKQLQEWYPEPPLVVMLSNNEHSRQTWITLEQNKRFMQRYGNKLEDDDFKRKVVGEGYIDRYRALQKGMRGGLANANWKEKTVFIAYGGDGAVCMGRWPGWMNYSLHTQDRVSPMPLMWDGCSTSYYQNHWSMETDYNVFSPQVSYMTDVFMKNEALRENPNFWYEVSSWDGYDGSAHEKKLHEKQMMSKREFYLAQHQSYTPARWAGFNRFGMWLLRPRVLRDFHYTVPGEEEMPFLAALMEAVDEVHDTQILREFWRKGSLVPNRAHPHPYQCDIPEQYKHRDRWFLLDADVNPQEYPLDYHWRIPVWSLALVRGEAPQRQWLVLAQSPLHETKEANVTIPDYKPVKVTATVGGSFFLVDEKTGAVSQVETVTRAKTLQASAAE
jgi:hypothetical protein